MEDGKLDIKKIAELRKIGVVREAGFIRAKIINRYKERKGKERSMMDLYHVLGNEFNLSEGRVKNIICEYNRNRKKSYI